MTAARLAFDRLSGGYGTALVVRAVTGGVAPGEALCILGRNGVGKTTLMKLLFGYLPCRSGSILWNGSAIETLEPTGRRELGIAYCPQERPVFENLSVRDNLTLMRRQSDVSFCTPYFARFPILARRLDQHAGTLSGGEKKLLSFVRGVSEEQLLLLLDEPSEGVQWENILHIAGVISEKKATGASFIIVEQNLAFAELVADRYLVMDQGRVVLEGARSTLRRTDLLAHLHV